MPYRKTILADGEVYHVYNRSVGNAEMFLNKRESERALKLLEYYRFNPDHSYSVFNAWNPERKAQYLDKILHSSPLVEIYAFAIMPNHFHLLLRQLVDKGVSTFVSKFQNAFSKYYNTKNDRHGTLFQNPFKAKWIETDELLMHMSRYIHLNPVTSFQIEFDQLSVYPLTSYPIYLSRLDNNLINTSFILKLFDEDLAKFTKYTMNQVDYQRKLKFIKYLTIDFV